MKGSLPCYEMADATRVQTAHIRARRERVNGHSRISKALALKPGTMSGSGGFLSASLAVAAAALALSTASGSANRTGGTGQGATRGGFPPWTATNCAN